MGFALWKQYEEYESSYILRWLIEGPLTGASMSVALQTPKLPDDNSSHSRNDTLLLIR